MRIEMQAWQASLPVICHPSAIIRMDLGDLSFESSLDRLPKDAIERAVRHLSRGMTVRQIRGMAMAISHVPSVKEVLDGMLATRRAAHKARTREAKRMARTGRRR